MLLLLHVSYPQTPSLSDRWTMLLVFRNLLNPLPKDLRSPVESGRTCQPVFRPWCRADASVVWPVIFSCRGLNYSSAPRLVLDKVFYPFCFFHSFLSMPGKRHMYFIYIYHLLLCAFHQTSRKSTEMPKLDFIYPRSFMIFSSWW